MNQNKQNKNFGLLEEGISKAAFKMSLITQALVNVKINRVELQNSCDVALSSELLSELCTNLVLTQDAEQESKKIMRKMGVKLNRENIGYQAVLNKHNMPLSLLPSCMGILRGRKVMSPVEKTFGIEKSKRQGAISQDWLNGPSNTKLMCMYMELWTQKTIKKRPNGYWTTVERLFKTWEYWVAITTEVYPSWETTQNYEEVKNWIREAQRLSLLPAEDLPNMEFKRVYIPKKGDGLPAIGNARPLGVPSPEWRIYQRGLNQVLLYFYQEKLLNQYAYQKGKSITSCWSKVLRMLESSEYVREFDLKGFFDNVTHAGIRDKLEEFKMPKTWVDRFMKLCKSVPKLSDKVCGDLVYEPDRKVRKLADGLPNPGYVPSSESTEYKEFGVPQGGATSCSLSILANNDLSWPKETKDGEKTMCIFYADDGIIVSNRKQLPGSINDPYRGLEENETKGRMVKVPGETLEDIELKFLGLKLNKGTFSSSGRNGKELILERKHYEYLWAKSHWKGIIRSLATQQRAKEVEKVKIWELQDSKDENLMDYVPQTESWEIVVRQKIEKGKVYPVQKVKLPFEPLEGRLAAQNYSIDQERTFPEYLRSIGRNFYDLKGRFKSLQHLLDSEESGAIIARMYQGSWKIPKEQEHALYWNVRNWQLKRGGDYLWKHKELMKWKVLKIGKLHNQSNHLIKKWLRKVLPNEKGEIEDKICPSLENSSSLACEDLLSELNAREQSETPKGLISFHIDPPEYVYFKRTHQAVLKMKCGEATHMIKQYNESHKKLGLVPIKAWMSKSKGKDPGK